MRTNTSTKRRSVLVAGLLAGLAGQIGLQTANAQQAAEPASKTEAPTTTKGGTVPVIPTAAPTPDAPADPQAPAAAAAPPATPPPVDLDTPFAFGDFTWMMANPRNHDEVLDGKYFSGEFRVDTNYMYDYNHPIDHTLDETTEGERTGEFRVDTNYIYDYQHPIDHTLDETTEGERTGEFVIQALGVGGDFHAGNMQGRILTQFGEVSTAVPRNDASYSLGQWDLADAYRYLTEMYAGYHINVQHGLNLQVGDFLSFIGLFSYYSFDN